MIPATSWRILCSQRNTSSVEWRLKSYPRPANPCERIFCRYCGTRSKLAQCVFPTAGAQQVCTTAGTRYLYTSLKAKMDASTDNPALAKHVHIIHAIIKLPNLHTVFIIGPLGRWQQHDYSRSLENLGFPSVHHVGLFGHFPSINHCFPAARSLSWVSFSEYKAPHWPNLETLHVGISRRTPSIRMPKLDDILGALPSLKTLRLPILGIIPGFTLPKTLTALTTIECRIPMARSPNPAESFSIDDKWKDLLWTLLKRYLKELDGNEATKAARRLRILRTDVLDCVVATRDMVLSRCTARLPQCGQYPLHLGLFLVKGGSPSPDADSEA
ncbi:hypothetical protein C8J56DRAFT_1166613 [Mycena floridula]|nr:hypothetical protein C8J56DRAFT_1166613 [Mycena floridula]